MWVIQYYLGIAVNVCLQVGIRVNVTYMYVYILPSSACVLICYKHVIFAPSGCFVQYIDRMHIVFHSV